MSADLDAIQRRWEVAERQSYQLSYQRRSKRSALLSCIMLMRRSLGDIPFLVGEIKRLRAAEVEKEPS